MDINVSAVPREQRGRPPADNELGFGRYFTDHMLMWDYSPERGWYDPRIVPYQPLSLSPACTVLHYGQEVFEGLKAYRGADGAIRLFRSRKNFERLRRSAERLCMTEPPDTDLLAEAVKQLVLLDQAWIPREEGCALYIRPNMIGIDPYLGIRPAENYLLYVILSPVGAYYPQGFGTISILVEEEYVRAVVGGVGEAKTGGNYAASLLGQIKAKKKGLTQVLWLDGKEHRHVEEVGTMNIFFVIGDEVVTPPLGGSILPGITRDSVLQLLAHWGDLRVSERPIGIDEVLAAADDGTLTEVFGTGTAAIISPVGSFRYRERDHTVADGRIGPLSRRLYDYLLGLQYGRVEDPFCWVEVIG